MSSATSSALPSQVETVVGQATSLQAGPTAKRPTYRLIQILRALAALIVVAHHATIMLWQRDHLPIGNWLNGSAGVDIFFIISGFVMTISSAPLRRATHPARTFLARRIERVVPMYWIVTTTKVAVLLLVPALGVNALNGWRHVLASYFFIPSMTPERVFEPVVIVGWTLNFEMAFYVLFASALAVRWRTLLVLAPVLLIVPLIPGQYFAHVPVWMQFYRSTLLWEFLFGMVLGQAIHWVRRIPWPVGLLVALGGLYPLLFWMAPVFSYWRGLFWGVPALAVVMGAISMEERWGARSPRWALELGDASYSIYLIHTFALPAVGLWLLEWPHRWRGEVLVALVASVALSTALGELAYRLVERPITEWFKGRRQTAAPANV